MGNCNRFQFIHSLNDCINAAAELNLNVTEYDEPDCNSEAPYETPYGCHFHPIDRTLWWSATGNRTSEDPDRMSLCKDTLGMRRRTLPYQFASWPLACYCSAHFAKLTATLPVAPRGCHEVVSDL